MTLTDHELTLVPSVVAAIAIIGGYLGVWSANQNATRIAREERQARQKAELIEIRRTLYARYLVALTNLVDARRVPWASGEEPPNEVQEAATSASSAAYGEALRIFHEVAIVAPLDISIKAEEILSTARNWQPFRVETHHDYAEALEDFRWHMREDLEGLGTTPDDPASDPAT